MRHSAMHRRLMLEWIRDCFYNGEPMPTVPAIVDRYGYAGAEQARTLLADLADAGQITLSGAGNAVVIQLRGVAPATDPAPADAVDRLPPTIIKADPAVDRVAALIVNLKSRGGIVPAAPVEKEVVVARKPEPTPSSVDPMLMMLREAGGSVDTMIARLIKRAEDAEARRPTQRPQDAEAIALLTKRAEAAEHKLATLKAMFA